MDHALVRPPLCWAAGGRPGAHGPGCWGRGRQRKRLLWDPRLNCKLSDLDLLSLFVSDAS